MSDIEAVLPQISDACGQERICRFIRGPSPCPNVSSRTREADNLPTRLSFVGTASRFPMFPFKSVTKIQTMESANFIK